MGAAGARSRRAGVVVAAPREGARSGCTAAGTGHRARVDKPRPRGRCACGDEGWRRIRSGPAGVSGGDRQPVRARRLATGRRANGAGVLVAARPGAAVVAGVRRPRRSVRARVLREPRRVHERSREIALTTGDAWMPATGRRRDLTVLVSSAALLLVATAAAFALAPPSAPGQAGSSYAVGPDGAKAAFDFLRLSGW